MELNKIYCGDSLEVLKTFPNEFIDCVITSPPYWSLRDYKTEPKIWDGDKNCEHFWNDKYIDFGRGQKDKSDKQKTNDGSLIFNNTSSFCSKCGAWKGSLGLEPSFDLYIKHLCDIFDEVKRVLKKEGTCWVNLGDTYAGGGGWTGVPDDWESISANSEQPRFDSVAKKLNYPSKCLVMIPYRFAIEMVKRGWVLRNTLIWHKSSCMPSSVTDRFTIDFEYLFFFSKNKQYFFEQQFEPSIDKECYEGRKPRNIGLMGKHDLKNYQFAGNIDENGKFKNEGKVYPCRNKRCVWTINPEPLSLPHFASFPTELVRQVLEAGCPKQVCNKCGKARNKICEPSIYSENGEYNISTNDVPYAVKERQGTINFRKLPLITDIKNYLNEYRNKNNFTIEEIEEKLNSQSPHHWFNGESYPTKNDWFKIKQLLNFDDKFDIAMTKEYFKPAEKLASPKKFIEYSDCGCSAGFSGGIVLDMFMGSGTTGLTAKRMGLNYVGIELNPEYIKIAERRIKSNSDMGLYDVLKDVDEGKQKSLNESFPADNKNENVQNP